MHVQLQFLADGFDVLEAFLEIGAGAADPDLGVVLDELGCEFSEGADDAFECRCDLFQNNVSIFVVAESLNLPIELTFVKFAIPPPMKSTLPSGCIGARSMRSSTVRA